jgi:hypothetical protein
MFTVIFSGSGLITFNDLPKGQNLNSQYLSGVIFGEIRDGLLSITQKNGLEEMMIHMDNCKVHHSKKTTALLQELQVTRLPHPPYFPDISPCDFWVFGWSNNQMRGKRFHGSDEVRTFLLELWGQSDENLIISVYHDWIQRRRQVIHLNVD